jgi:hypothetical protein
MASALNSINKNLKLINTYKEFFLNSVYFYIRIKINYYFNNNISYYFTVFNKGTL